MGEVLRFPERRIYESLDAAVARLMRTQNSFDLTMKEVASVINFLDQLENKVGEMARTLPASCGKASFRRQQRSIIGKINRARSLIASLPEPRALHRPLKI